MQTPFLSFWSVWNFWPSRLCKTWVSSPGMGFKLKQPFVPDSKEFVPCPCTSCRQDRFLHGGFCRWVGVQDSLSVAYRVPFHPKETRKLELQSPNFQTCLYSVLFRDPHGTFSANTSTEYNPVLLLKPCLATKDGQFLYLHYYKVTLIDSRKLPVH